MALLLVNLNRIVIITNVFIIIHLQLEIFVAQVKPFTKTVWYLIIKEKKICKTSNDGENVRSVT